MAKTQHKKPMHGKQKRSPSRGLSESGYVDALAKRLGKPRSEVKRELAIQSEVIAHGLRSHGAVRTNLGAIKVKKVPARKGGQLVRNPFTGQMVKAKAKPATNKVRLSPSKKFRDRV